MAKKEQEADRVNAHAVASEEDLMDHETQSG